MAKSITAPRKGPESRFGGRGGLAHNRKTTPPQFKWPVRSAEQIRQESLAEDQDGGGRRRWGAGRGVY